MARNNKVTRYNKEDHARKTFGTKSKGLNWYSYQMDPGTLDTLAADDIFDPFELAEERAKTMEHKQKKEELERLILGILGAEDYEIYVLYTREKFPSELLAKYYGLTDFALRKRIERSKKKIIRFAETMDQLYECQDRIYDLVVPLRDEFVANYSVTNKDVD
ncbi:MAG: hypothetical protein ACRCX2_10565 [Paraclostridium sp.]